MSRDREDTQPALYAFVAAECSLLRYVLQALLNYHTRDRAPDLRSRIYFEAIKLF